MIAKGGTPLLNPDAVELLRQVLLPQTYLLTPNIPEAEALTGMAIRGEEAMEEAVRALQQMGPRNVLLKGGHRKGEAVDLLLAGDALHRFPAERIATRNTHGTGCSYAAAIATFLAQGLPLVAAVARAKASSTQRSALPPTWGAATGRSTTGQGARAVPRPDLIGSERSSDPIQNTRGKP